MYLVKKKKKKKKLYAVILTIEKIKNLKLEI